MGTDRKAFHLRWNNHMENMRSLFETSYCDQALVDVTVSCPDGKLRAHKLVLSACSPYFESVFKENPCKHPVLIMKGISYKEMSCLLEYMYKGEVDVLETDLQSLISTASDLQIRGLGYGYQTETTVAAAKAAPNPLRNTPAHNNKSVKAADMAPVATPKSQSQVITKAPEFAATALNQDFDMNSSMETESMSRQRPQKRTASKPPFDSVKVKKECENYFSPRQLVTPVLPKAPNSNSVLSPGLCSPSVGQPAIPSAVPSGMLPIQNSSSSCGSPIGLTVPSVSLLSGVMAARNSSSPPNKYGSTPNGVPNNEATNLTMNRHNHDQPTDLTSASNGLGNSEDDERREMEDDDIDEDDENELHIDTSKMEVSIKEELDEDDDTIGYLCESTFTEGETTNGLSEKTEVKESTEENYEKEGTVCPFCFRDCKTTDALKRHVRIHTSQKPHQCEYCQLAFARSSHLERHRRTHTGERPFVCPIASCSKRFARQDKVKQHVIRHHTGLPRPVRQSSPKTYKPRAPMPVPIQPGGKRPRGRPRKHPSPEDFMGHLYHGHTLLDDGGPNNVGGGQPCALPMTVSESVNDPLTCPPAKDFANLSARNSPADFLQRDSESCITANEGLSTLELSVSTQEHIQGLKQISVEPVATTADSVADTASVGT